MSLPTLMTLVDGDIVDHVVDDARAASKEDGRVEDTESYGDQYRTEILERQVTRIDRPRSMITSVTLQIRKYVFRTATTTMGCLINILDRSNYSSITF